MEPLRVLIAEDEPALLRALSRMVSRDAGLRVVATGENADEAIAAAERERPDVAVLDVIMPGGGGVRAAREIRARCPGTRIVALSGHKDRDSVLEMVHAGAASYLIKSDPPEDIIATIHGDRAHLSNDVAGTVLAELSARLRAADEQELKRDALRNDLIAATHGDALTMAFQPIVDLRSGALVGAEALARFDGEPQRPPDQWLADAERVGMRQELERECVRRALAGLDRLPDDAFLAINVTPETAMLQALLEDIPAEVGHRIVVEVTEHTRVDDYESLVEALDDLRSIGARVAVDDAGAGFASLRHIVRLEPDFIKLDAALTRNVDRDGTLRALTHALISFADQIGTAVIAEGIETQSEFEALRGMGVVFGQGYLLARPGPLPADGRPLAVSVSIPAIDADNPAAQLPSRRHDRTSGDGGELFGGPTFLDLVQREWAWARRDRTTSCIVRLTIADLPGLVAAHGQPAAALLLDDLSGAAQGAARDGDCVGRLSEAEIGVVLVGCRSTLAAGYFCDEVGERLRAVFAARGVEAQIAGRVGQLGSAASVEQAIALDGAEERHLV